MSAGVISDICDGTWSRQIRTHITRTPNGRRRSAHARPLSRREPVMALRSKLESHRPRKPEISIRCGTAISGERLAPSPIDLVGCDALNAGKPLIVRGEAPRIPHLRDEGGCAPQKVSCANPTIVTSSGADEQLRPFTNWRARSYCEHSVCRVFMDASRQHLAAIARIHSR